MKTPMEVLIDHAQRTLPDSLSARRELLSALNMILRPEHPSAKAINLMLAGIDAHDNAQGLLFPTDNPAPNRNGDDSGRDDV